MEKTSRRQLNIEAADIGFRNFEGREGKYNKLGDRSFAVFLDDELAHILAKEGWNVKFPKDQDPNDEEDNRRAYLQVSVAFDSYPAKVYLITPQEGEPNINMIGGEEAVMLDWAEFSNIDLVIRPYNWEVNGNRGIKAYLKAGYFSIVTDEFAQKHGI